MTTAFGLPGLRGHWWEALLNLTMVQRLFGVPHIDDVYWTLTVELAFYALMWLLLVTKQLGRVELFGTLWLILMALCGVAERAWGVSLPDPITNFLLLQHGNLFFAGILFYRLYRGSASHYTLPLLAFCLGVQLLVATPATSAVVAGFFALFGLLGAGCGFWCSRRCCF